MSRGRLEALQWFGLLAGPLAFAAEHVAGLYAAFADCSPAGSRWAVPQHTIQLAAMAAAALVIAAAEAGAFLAFREVEAVDREGDPPPGRIKFLSTAALIVGPIFLTLVLLSGLGAAAHSTCHQG